MKMKNMGPSRRVQSFPGGSHSETSLYQQISGGQYFVRKLARGLDRQKLKEQAQWLSKHQGRAAVPNVISTVESPEEFILDLEYYSPDWISLSQFLVTAGSREQDEILGRIFSRVLETPMISGEQNSSFKDYLRDKIELNIKNQVMPLAPEFSELVLMPEVQINSTFYPNILQLYHSLVSRVEMIQCLRENQSVFDIHGDLTIENIYIHQKTGEFVFFDPNPNNPIRDLAVEVAKLFQSCDGEYEMLLSGLNGRVRVVGPGSFHFTRNLTPHLSQFQKKIEEASAKQWGPDFNKIARLHEAVHFCRLLPYRARKNPNQFLSFYLQSILLLDRSLKEFS